MEKLELIKMITTSIYILIDLSNENYQTEGLTFIEESFDSETLLRR